MGVRSCDCAVWRREERVLRRRDPGVQMIGSEITTGTAGSVAATTACCGVAALLLGVLVAADGSARFGFSSPDECALDGLWFYYDEDDQLQCVCLDDEDIAGDLSDFGA